MATGQGSTGDQRTVARRLYDAARDGQIETVRDLLRKHPSEVDSVDDGGTTALMVASYWGHTDVVQLLLEAGANINKKNDRGQSALHWAVFSGKVDVVKTLLERGAEINSVDRDGNTPLFDAIREGNTEVIELLINHPEIDLSIKNKQGQNLLHCAFQYRKVDIVTTLLERGAEINSVVDSVVDDGTTALMVASYKGHTDVVELLLEAGASINKRDDRGWSALQWAVFCRKVDVVKKLLERGAEINSVDGDGNTPLFYAIRRWNTEVIELLINHPEIDLSIKNIQGQNLLHCASQCEEVALVKTFLQRRVEINSVDNDGNTPLHLAVKEGYKDVIEPLINHPNIDFCIKNKEGRNVLHLAVLEMKEINQKVIVQKMLEKGAEINSVDNDKNTSLHLAVKDGNKDVIKLLINHPKVDFSIKNKKGRNLLHLVVQKMEGIDQEEVLQKMVEKGVDINSVDDHGNTSLHLAVKEGNKDAIKLLIKHPKTDFSILNKKGFNVLHLAILRTKKIYRKEVLQIMFGKGVDINSKDKDGDTPIHIAVHKGETEVTELLIDQPNIDLSLCNYKGFTVLSLAVLRNDLITTKLLIDKHPSIINTKDRNGLTALHLAAHNGHDQIVSFLIEKGADLKLRNYLQQTPLMVAVQASQLSTVKLLVKNGADLNVSDENGDSCLHLSVRKYSASTQTDSDQALTLEGFTIVCFLLRNGADVNMRNKKGMTAFDLIQDTEKRKNFEMLVETCL